MIEVEKERRGRMEREVGGREVRGPRKKQENVFTLNKPALPPAKYSSDLAEEIIFDPAGVKGHHIR